MPRLWLIDLARGSELLIEVGRRHKLVPAADARSESRDTSKCDPGRVAARIALRALLAGYAGLEAVRLPFAVAPQGKPSLVAGHNPRAIEFSLAHCHVAAIVAVSVDGPVGVDVEAPRAVRIDAARRETLLAAAASLSRDPLPTGDARFLQGWVRLEALAKATGEGLGSLLSRLRAGTHSIADTHVNDAPVRVRDIACGGGRGLCAAVAGTGEALATDHPAPVPTVMPLDADWIDRWMSGPPADASPDFRSVSQRPNARL